MGRVIALTLLAASLAPLHAATAPKNPSSKLSAKNKLSAKKPFTSHAGPIASRVAVNRAPARASSRVPLRQVAAVRAPGRVGAGRHSARSIRAIHTAPAPTYQLHPDPDRYIAIQKALADKGYFKGEPNGEWSDDSIDAMRRFQADLQIDDDGKIDALSLIALGLGPKHDGISVPLPPSPAPVTTPAGVPLPTPTK